MTDSFAVEVLSALHTEGLVLVGELDYVSVAELESAVGRAGSTHGASNVVITSRRWSSATARDARARALPRRRSNGGGSPPCIRRLLFLIKHAHLLPSALHELRASRAGPVSSLLRRLARRPDRQSRERARTGREREAGRRFPPRPGARERCRRPDDPRRLQCRLDRREGDERSAPAALGERLLERPPAGEPRVALVTRRRASQGFRSAGQSSLHGISAARRGASGSMSTPTSYRSATATASAPSPYERLKRSRSGDGSATRGRPPGRSRSASARAASRLPQSPRARPAGGPRARSR